jgi:hypothetical protein
MINNKFLKNKFSKNNFFAILLASSLVPAAAFGFAQSNFFRPTDQALRLPVLKNTKFQVGAMVEHGSRDTGLNWNDKRRNVLALHDDKQNAIRMLKGSKITSVQNIWQNDFVTKGVDSIPESDAGMNRLSGSFNQTDFTFFGHYNFTFLENKIPGVLAVKAYLPIVSKKISGVKIEDLSPLVADWTTFSWGGAKKAVGDLGKDLLKNVKTWSGLELSNWSKTGLGDMALTLNWHNYYKQNKEYLKLVGLFMHGGFLLPTGSQKDENQAFSMPMGSDGAWGIPLGVGLELGFIHDIKAGVNVDFLGFFDKSRERRMKTDENQTEFLLLNKGEATKESGLTWQFNLFLQWFHFFDGFSAKAAYQFVKHDDDRLCPKGNDFNYRIVNTANSLREWSFHNLAFFVNYDFKALGEYFDADTFADKVTPQLSFFFKFPVAGRNGIDNRTLGGQLAFSF